jgi:hypothetical protein
VFCTVFHAQYALQRHTFCHCVVPLLIFVCLRTPFRTGACWCAILQQRTAPPRLRRCVPSRHRVPRLACPGMTGTLHARAPSIPRRSAGEMDINMPHLNHVCTWILDRRYQEPQYTRLSVVPVITRHLREEPGSPPPYHPTAMRNAHFQNFCAVYSAQIVVGTMVQALSAGSLVSDAFRTCSQPHSKLFRNKSINYKKQITGHGT